MSKIVEKCKKTIDKAITLWYIINCLPEKPDDTKIYQIKKVKKVKKTVDITLIVWYIINCQPRKRLIYKERNVL